jgi:phage-related minor tail protein
MARTYVDLPLALRSVSINRMIVARKVRREMKREENAMKVLIERQELEGQLMLITHNVNQLRKAFSRIAKLEKRIKERKERNKHPRDRMAGRNQGNFRNR